MGQGEYNKTWGGSSLPQAGYRGICAVWNFGGCVLGGGDDRWRFTGCRLARESSDDRGGLVFVRAFADDFGADDGIGSDVGIFSGFFIGKVDDFEQT